MSFEVSLQVACRRSLAVKVENIWCNTSSGSSSIGRQMRSVTAEHAAQQRPHRRDLHRVRGLASILEGQALQFFPAGGFAGAVLPW